MFFYPDPEPIGHCITDVSPSYLTDGVFFNGRSIGPTHKCVAKQLSAIPRKPNDPVAPGVDLNPRTLENWTLNSKAWYVDNCGRNARALHGMMGLLPKEKVDAYAGWKSRDKDKIPNCIHQSAVRGLPDDREFHRPDSPTRLENKLIRKKQSLLDPPRAHDEPAVIYGQENYRDENEMLQQKVNKNLRNGINEGGNLKDDAANCKCSQFYTPHESPLIGETVDAENDDDVKKEPGIDEYRPHAVEYDPRWHLWHGVYDVPRNDIDRKNAMLNLYRPHHHEINTWYSRNKPTKPVPTVSYEGKRPILEWHFSNL